MQDLSTLQCDVCVLVFSVTDRRSFHRTAQLRLLLREAQPQTPIILAGNKSDLVRSREISSEGAQKGRAASVRTCDSARRDGKTRKPVHSLPHYICPRCCETLMRFDRTVMWPAGPMVLLSPPALLSCCDGSSSVSYHCKAAALSRCYLFNKDLR